MSNINWGRVAPGITAFNGLRCEAKLADGSDVGIFREKHSRYRWSYRRRLTGGCWGHAVHWDTKREAIEMAERHFGDKSTNHT